MKPLKIVFAGTPAFTLPCLQAIAASEHELQAVYTQPDRPAGRGRALQSSAVKTWALQHDVPVYQPLNFKDSQSLNDLRALSADILVVIAYGLILPRAVLDIPRLGCINVHASLLPSWRGASPIQQSILHGDACTGITIMQLDVGMDTGPMFMQVSCQINSDDTTESLHDRLAELAPAPLLETLNALSSNKAHAIEQDHLMATYAPKIKKDDAIINWEQSVIEIDRQIRAFNPWPITYTHIDNQVMRIHQAQILSEPSKHKPGTIVSMDKHGLSVATGDFNLLVERVQFSGGKVMSIADYLNSTRSQLQMHMVFK